jgi:polyhydroxyalkanoate synthase
VTPGTCSSAGIFPGPPSSVATGFGPEQDQDAPPRSGRAAGDAAPPPSAPPSIDTPADATPADAAPGAAGDTAPEAPDLAAAARDWEVIWRSEAAVLATDRELRETWGAGLAATPGALASFWPSMSPPAATPQDPAPERAASDRPGPMHRRGPRPLSLHLAAAAMSAAPPAALLGTPPAWQSGAPGGSRPVPDAGFLAGIAAYRRHPFRRALPDPPCLWHEGDTRLLDYGASRAASGTVPGQGPGRAAANPVLFVPSLVNRAQVLDLLPGRSMLRWLAARGVHPLLLDWGWPGAVERRFTLTDYIAGRLERAVASLGRPVILAGYCMGGLLCTALAARRPDLVAGLVLLATPWDFHAGDPTTADPAPGADFTRAPALIAPMLAAMEPILALTGALGVDALQTLFELAGPGAVADKYRSFARLARDSERARCFVAIEDWLADGVPLAAPVARECLGGWYGANTPARGEWRVAGLAVAPGALRLPSLVVVPARDRIVPAASALALADALPGSTVLRPAAGHVGMIVGSRAERELWAPLRDWLLRHDAGA